MSAERDEGAPPASTGRLTTWVLAAVFAVLFAGPTFWGLSDLVEYPAYAGGRTPWWLLIIGVVAPLIAYVAALLLTRGRSTLVRVIILIAALAAANALCISVIRFALSAVVLG
jgi:hypothetical protein